MVGDRNALFEFRHVVKRRRRVGNIRIQFDVEVLDIAVEHHGEPHHALAWPRPRFVDKTKLAERFCVVVPFVWNVVGLCVERVLRHLFKVIEFEGIGIPEQRARVFLNFNIEEQGVTVCCKLELIAFADEQLHGLCDNAPVGHDPIRALEETDSLTGSVNGFITLSLGEINVPTRLQRADVDTGPNSHVVEYALKVIAVAACAHASDVELVAIQFVFVAVI